MVTTTVNGAKSDIMALATNGIRKPGEKENADSFQKVFDKQTMRNDGKASKVGKEKNPHLKKQDALRSERVKTKSSEKDDVTMPKEEQEERIGKVVNDAAREILDEMAELFQIPQEEIGMIMQQMGMETQDLLSESNLQKLTMEIAGIEEPATLLTDGELYGKMQALMRLRTELMENAEQTLGMDADAFLERFEAIAENDVRVAEPDPADWDQNVKMGTVEEPITQMRDVSEKEDVQKGKITVEVVKDDDAVQTTEPVKPQNTESTGNKDARDDHPAQEKEPGTGNLVLEQMRQVQAALSAEGAEGQINAPESADTEMIMRQILDHMKVQIKPEVTSLEMQLHPASLGNVQVQLTSRGGAITAQFFAQNEAVKAALETQMIQLQESFSEQGIKVEAIEVSVQTQQFEQNLEEQGRGRQQQQPKSRGTRRLRIDEPLSQQQLDELTKDERLQAEMMQAGGGTVDFTA